MTRRSRTGFTVTELLLSLTLLAMGIAVAFGIFDFGIYGFRIGVMRQSLQSEGRRAMSLLERDIRQSNLDGTSTELTNELSPQEPRNAICLPGMDDFSFSGNFNNLGDPLYNRYLLYYTTLAKVGALYRVEIDPTSPPGDNAWVNFPTDFGVPPWSVGPPTITDLPGTVPPLQVRKLCENVSGFRVLLPGNTCVVAQLTLRGKARVPGQKERDEILQFNIYTPVYSTHTDPNNL